MLIPAWFAPLFVLPTLVLYSSYKMLSLSILATFFIFTLADGANRLNLGTVGGPVLLGAQPLTALVVMVSGLERGWFSDSLLGRLVLTGAFLLGFALYWLLAAQLERLGIIAVNLVVFGLLTLLSAGAGWYWKRVHGGR